MSQNFPQEKLASLSQGGHCSSTLQFRLAAFRCQIWRLNMIPIPDFLFASIAILKMVLSLIGLDIRAEGISISMVDLFLNFPFVDICSWAGCAVALPLVQVAYADGLSGMFAPALPTVTACSSS